LSVISAVLVPATQNTMLGALLFASVLCIMALGVFALISGFRTAVFEVNADALVIQSSSAIDGVVLTQESWRSNQS
jgi:hypothetical protein